MWSLKINWEGDLSNLRGRYFFAYLFTKFNNFSQKILLFDIKSISSLFINNNVFKLFIRQISLIIPLLPDGGGGYTVLPLSVLPSVQDIFRRIFLSNCWWQKSDFWTCQIPTSCLPTWLVFIHIEHICSFFVAFFSATIDARYLIFCHKLHIGTPYCGKRFWTHQIPTSCLSILLIFIHV